MSDLMSSVEHNHQDLSQSWSTLPAEIRQQILVAVFQGFLGDNAWKLKYREQFSKCIRNLRLVSRQLAGDVAPALKLFQNILEKTRKTIENDYERNLSTRQYSESDERFRIATTKVMLEEKLSYMMRTNSVQSLERAIKRYLALKKLENGVDALSEANSSEIQESDDVQSRVI